MTDWLVHLLNPLRPLCDAWCLHVWETLGAWFAGLATFAAVVVSLLLARRDQIRLRVSAEHRIEVGGRRVEPPPEFLYITVRNVGSRSAIVEGVGWRRRPWGKLHGYQAFDPTAGFPAPPVKVAAGSAHHFRLPLNHTEMQWGESFLKDFVGRWPRLGVRLVRAHAWTPAGDQFYAPLEESLRRWLIAKADSMKRTKGAA
jgi:hypothetical protein